MKLQPPVRLADLAELMGRLWTAGSRIPPRGNPLTDDALGSPAERVAEPLEELILQVTQPRHLAGVALTVGVVWYATRGAGMLGSALLGVPVWRQVDLLPLLAAKDK